MRRLRESLTARGAAFLGSGIVLVVAGLALGQHDLSRIGTALCALSVLLAAVAVARTEAPRSAAGLLVLGILLLFLGAYLSPRPFVVQDIPAAWRHLMTGSLTLN